MDIKQKEKIEEEIDSSEDRNINDNYNITKEINNILIIK